MSERTLSIIKPDAARRNLTGLINSYFEKAGLSIVAQKRMRISYDQAALFYAVHKERPFFQDLCKSVSSGPVVVQVLSGDGAIALNRKIMGSTNPANADNETIRKDFGLSIEENSVHGSDSVESAEKEISFFFSEIEILP